MHHQEAVIENTFLPSLNIKDYNVLVDGRNFYDQKFLTILRNMKS